MVPDTMDALEWLRKHFDADGSDLLREMVRTFAERLMAAEVEVLCNAGYGEVTPETNQPPQRVPAPPARHPGRLDRVGGPQAAGGQLLPELAVRAPPPRRAGAGGGGGGVLRQGRLDAAGRGAGADAGYRVLVEEPGEPDGQGTSTPRWRRSAAGRWTAAPTRTCRWTP